MSEKKLSSSTGYYRGLLVGAVIALTIMAVVNQITSSVNIKPGERLVALKEEIQSHWFDNNDTKEITADQQSTPNLPPVLLRKPMNEEKSMIKPVQQQDSSDMVTAVVSPKTKPSGSWTPPTYRKPIVREPLQPDPTTLATNSVSTAIATVNNYLFSNSSTIIKPKSRYIPLSRAECAVKYGERKFYAETSKRLPPMLYTFPGSGNTWCRLLIEYSSGILSGAVYNDATLLEPLPGEYKCNHYVSVVKVHPHTHEFEHLRTGKFHSDNDKCIKGNVKQFKRAILLIRNPFDSIWSEFQRRVSKSHVEGVNRAGFDWHRWQANACSLSHMYHKMWAEHHAGIEQHFSKENYLYIKYEDLKDKTGFNVDAMKKVTDFLHVPATEEKLSCAFVLAENPDAHRKVDASKMTKQEAYTKELACRMWALFGEFAEKHGYKPINNYDCNNETDPYPKIRNVNVGAQGEYDEKWVKPGQKLIDFGGYNKSAYARDGSFGQLRLGTGGMRHKVRPGTAPVHGNSGQNGLIQKQLKQQARRDRKQQQKGLGANTKISSEGNSGSSGSLNGVTALPGDSTTDKSNSDKKAVSALEVLDGIGQVGLNQPAWK